MYQLKTVHFVPPVLEIKNVTDELTKLEKYEFPSTKNLNQQKRFKKKNSKVKISHIQNYHWL